MCCLDSVNNVLFLKACLDLRDYEGPKCKLLLSFTVISDFTGPSFLIKLHLLSYVCLTQWISKFPGSFEIHWVRQYSVNITGFAGIVNPTVYKIEPNFTGLGGLIVIIFNTVYWYVLVQNLSQIWVAAVNNFTLFHCGLTNLLWLLYES